MLDESKEYTGDIDVMVIEKFYTMEYGRMYYKIHEDVCEGIYDIIVNKVDKIIIEMSDEIRDKIHELVIKEYVIAIERIVSRYEILSENKDKIRNIVHVRTSEIGNNIYKKICNKYRDIIRFESDKDRHVWKDHDIYEITWKVETRMEKRERLSQIFKYHKGYFWMDNLCIDESTKAEDKPLEIMGDIYRKCLECICMLDTICIVDEFESEKDLLTIMSKDMKKMTGKELRDKYGYEYYISYKLDTPQRKRTAYLGTMKHNIWYGRVWTWQEADLLLFCNEQAGGYRYDPFDHEFLRELFPIELYKIDKKTNKYPSEFDDWREGANVILHYFRPIMELAKKDNDIWENIRIAKKSSRKCTNMVDYVYGIAGILNLSIPKGLELDDAMVELEYGLQKQGIFVRERNGYRGFGPNGDDCLYKLYEKRKLIDGIIVLGRVDGLDYEEHDKILSKVEKDMTNITEVYNNVCYEYETETKYISHEWRI